MIKHRELSDPTSCLNKADALEPVFVLRAKDPMAPQAVRLWAAMSTGRHEPEKLQEALKWADHADEWLTRNIVEGAPKVPGRTLADHMGSVAGAAVYQGHNRNSQG